MHTLPMKLRASRLKWSMMLLGSLLFVAVGIWLLSSTPSTGIGIMSIAFFGLCALVALINLHPACSYLVLTDEGFTYVNLFRRQFIAWDQVERFVQWGDFVGLNLKKEFAKNARLRKVNHELLGVQSALPDTYGKSVKELTSLMEGLREKYSNAVRPSS
jgi:hypothetical protein